MIRPCRFFPNPETAADNAFQQSAATADREMLSECARREFDKAVELLRFHGVTVRTVEDTVSPEKPDAVFPNNWISTHDDGRVALYPMLSAARRWERRTDVVNELRQHYQVTKVVDYSVYEDAEQFLEGTGSLVLDHIARVAYVSTSQRSHAQPLQQFCADFDFEPVTFRSVDESGRAIYHTNVMMCVGTNFALVGLRSIPDAVEREQVRDRLRSSGRQIIELAPEQIANFAGNAIELHNKHKQLLVLSTHARAALTGEQIRALERYVRIVPLDLPTIELAGGSARCMIATIHLPSR